MAAIPRWLLVLVVVAVVLLVLNATHLLNIHFNISAQHIAESLARAA